MESRVATVQYRTQYLILPLVNCFKVESGTWQAYSPIELVTLSRFMIKEVSLRWDLNWRPPDLQPSRDLSGV